MARDCENERVKPSNGKRERERARRTQKEREGPSNSEGEQEGPNKSLSNRVTVRESERGRKRA